MSAELKVAIEAAKKGAEEALKYYNEPLKVDIKVDSTVVSKADKETEKVIKKFILSQDKKANILAEESGGDFSNSTFWVLDPIDGTRSYLRGIPFWCVLVTFFRENMPVLTACYFPLFDELIYSEVGRGAFINEKRMHVSKIDSIKRSLLSYGNIQHFNDKTSLLRVCEQVGSTRSPDPTYGACLLADGRMDIIIDAFAHIWDTAPFQIIIAESGGRITNLEGRPISKKGVGYIATNGLLHDEVLKIYNGK